MMTDSVVEGVPDRYGMNIKDIPCNLYSEINSDAHNSNESRSQTSDNLEGHGAIVAAHYNTIEEKGLEERNKSRIVYLRNFNNWIKSMLIDEYLKEIKDNKKQYNAPLKVLDMCCGKGGDLFKWRSGRISHLICADLAETSVEQCENRYKDLRDRADKEPYRMGPLFTAEFIAADCTKTQLRQKYKDVTIELDLVSCQFSFHYSFESLAQAECLLRNASECLQPGGYLIGTMPDAYEIVTRLEKSGGLKFGNEVYEITFESRETPFPLFGAKYNFHLEGVVDCPEFLVHFPTLEKLALKYGLELVRNEKFEDYFNSERKLYSGRRLLTKMQALETYPPAEEDTKLIGNEKEDYDHAKDYLEKHKTKQIGTLSKPEWQAATLYLVFAFRKMHKLIGDKGEVTYKPFVPKPKEREDDNDYGEPKRKYARRD